MSVNGVTQSQAGAYTYASSASAENTKTTTAAENASAANDKGVVYEPSKGTSTKKTYTPDQNLINKLKADADARTSQLRSLVEKMIGGQANAYGNANDIWSFLRGGNYTVDPATKLQAQKDIAEDGYWGVTQTSDRIIDFATALTGGDPDKIEDMKAAFEKGYKMAEKKWGGELPDISKRTYDAVLEKFDKLAAEAGITE